MKNIKICFRGPVLSDHKNNTMQQKQIKGLDGVWHISYISLDTNEESPTCGQE